MSHKTIADRVRFDPDPYKKSIAVMSHRNVDHDRRTVTFHFEDDSELTFDVTYTLQSEDHVPR